MQHQVKLPMYLSWRTLKQLVGWPYSRTHTGRMMFDPDYAEQRFPACRKLGTHRSSHPVWYTPDVLEYFKRHGLPVPENVEFS
jgi:hypothetical protein